MASVNRQTARDEFGVRAEPAPVVVRPRTTQEIEAERLRDELARVDVEYEALGEPYAEKQQIARQIRERREALIAHTQREERAIAELENQLPDAHRRGAIVHDRREMLARKAWDINARLGAIK